MQKLIFIVAAIILQATASNGKTNDWYAAKWCVLVKGENQVRMADGTVADCVTSDTAYEVEFAKDHYQGIGQALHYAAVSKKKPGLVIVLRSPGDEKYYKRVENSVAYHGIQIELVKFEDLKSDFPKPKLTDGQATVPEAPLKIGQYIDLNAKEEGPSAEASAEASPPVKLSRSGICHDEDSPYYYRTKHFTPYNSMDECLATGARRPKN